MRKVIFQEWLSMDGYAADVNDSVRFIEPYADYSDQEQLEFLDGIDLVLLGATTYRLFIDFWPTATNEEQVIADKLNSLPKIIFSRTMRTAPWGKWPEARVQPDAVEAVRRLKEEKGKDIVLWGSISVAQALMKEGLIDEYHLRICPLVLGSGKLLFGPGMGMKFELFGTRQYGKGVMLLQYRKA